jgi:type I restriction enzyme, S subunit
VNRQNHIAEVKSQVDALKPLQAESAAEVDVLLPSILDKAFKGDL